MKKVNIKKKSNSVTIEDLIKQLDNKVIEIEEICTICEGEGKVNKASYFEDEFLVDCDICDGTGIMRRKIINISYYER